MNFLAETQTTNGWDVLLILGFFGIFGIVILVALWMTVR